jgi:small subunit ribosomal protein S7
MPRKARSYKRHQIEADPRYNNVKVAKFINHVMRHGKKSVAQKVVYEAFNHIKKTMNTEPRQIFDAALKNVSPILEVKSRRIGGANYQVPLEVVDPRKTTLGMRWLIDASRSRKGKPMHIKLAEEIMSAYNNEGAAIKKKDDTHRMAEANWAFAHFARFQKRK